MQDNHHRPHPLAWRDSPHWVPICLLSLSVLCLSHYPMHVSAPRGSLKKSQCDTPAHHPLQPPLVSLASAPSPSLSWDVPGLTLTRRALFCP